MYQAKKRWGTLSTTSLTVTIFYIVNIFSFSLLQRSWFFACHMVFHVQILVPLTAIYTFIYLLHNPRTHIHIREASWSYFIGWPRRRFANSLLTRLTKNQCQHFIVDCWLFFVFLFLVMYDDISRFHRCKASQNYNFFTRNHLRV